MEAIKKQQLPEALVNWFDEATAGRRQSSYKVYGYNTRFVLIRNVFESLYQDKAVHWYVIEWETRKGFNIFLFKKSGSLNKVDRAKIKKDFSIDLGKRNSKLSL